MKCAAQGRTGLRQYAKKDISEWRVVSIDRQQVHLQISNNKRCTLDDSM